MDEDFIAMLIAIFIITVGVVAILRPMGRRLGDIVEMMLRGKQGEAEGELRRMGDLLETVSARMALLEERQDFTERLFASPDREKDVEEDPPL